MKRLPEAESALPRVLLVAMITASVYMWYSGTVLREAYTGDEGAFGIMALNMIHDTDMIAHPSFNTGGDENWLEVSMPSLAFPPFYSAILALAYMFSGGRLGAFDFLHAATFFLTLLTVYGTCAFWDRRAAFFTTLLLAVSPVMALTFGILEAEPLMTAFGFAGLYFFVRGEMRRSPWAYVLAGGFLGLSYLTKLWLVAPFGLAVGAVFFLNRIYNRKIELADAAYLGFAAFGFIAMGSLHILFVAIVAGTDDVVVWLRDCYFGIFTGAISSTKFTADNIQPEWIHPVWYYPGIMYRDHYFLLPLGLLTLPALMRSFFKENFIPITTCLAGLSAIILLSTSAVKEPLYILPSLVFAYGIVGIGLARIFSEDQRPDRVTKTFAGITCVFCVVMAMGIVFAYSRGMKSDDLTGQYAAVHTVVMLALAAFAVLVGNGKMELGSRAFTWGCIVTLAGFIVIHSIGKYPYQRVIADVIRPHLAMEDDPSKTVFMANNYRGISLILFQDGRYWASFYTSRPENCEELAPYRAIVLGPEELADEETQALLPCLEAKYLELTEQVNDNLDTNSGYRVFVNPEKSP